ncbi:NAD(P)-binding domain-containing protein [Paenibacillus koleovorans]|uniref:NAD(P)-binding domain-containing protein n=1 Tax=Paenibacillus koleovorans TaxID=121608 RepID=UPI000FD6E4AE|nr:NAD(P)-binding domain-containing protein [Paenibacillus koleovorans]
MLDLAIIGAGAYGISLAAHARSAGLHYKLFGYPMFFWQHQMPQSMFIRTNPQYISFSDPEDVFTIHRFSEETGTPLSSPFPRKHFLEYAFWFAEKAEIVFTPELIHKATYEEEAYTLINEGGETYRAKHVVIATGVQHYAYIPDTFAGIGTDLVSHSFGRTEFSIFAGKRVAVLGSGQSAWETAALLHIENSQVELIYRKELPHYGGENNLDSGRNLVDLAYTFYAKDPEQKQERWSQPHHGSITYFLRPYVEGKVPETGGVTIDHAWPTEERKLRLRLSNGEERIVDHLIAATGYRIDLDRVPFLDETLRRRIGREAPGYEPFPRLDSHFQSSLPGLFFAGPLASHSHGPSYRLIAGVRHASRSILARITGRE